MINLHKESIYLQGARDMLLRLQEDYDMYIIPCVLLPYKSEFIPNNTGKLSYPISNTKMRKLLGKGLIDTLLKDRQSLVNFLQGQTNELTITNVTKDKKGNTTKIELIIK